MFRIIANYVNEPPEGMSGTMIWLREFNDYLIEDETLYMKTRTATDTKHFPCVSVRLFIIMQSHESTHQPIAVSYTAKNKLSKAQWIEVIESSWVNLLADIHRILTIELRPDLEWWLYEFIGWTADPDLHNAEEAAQAFRCAGHPVKTTHGKRHKAYD